MKKTHSLKTIPQKPKKNNNLWIAKGEALKVANDLIDAKPNAKLKILNFLEKTLKRDQQFQDIAFSWLVKKRIFSLLDPKDMFEFCIKCLKAKNVKLLNETLKAVKLQNPLKIDLALFSTDYLGSFNTGETLGHLAAKLDDQKALKVLSKINPDYLRVKNGDGDTIPHIASKFLSQKSIEFMMQKYPGLFWIRNNKGLKPSDLEGGPLINKSISEEEIQKAWAKDNETYKHSLEKLQNATHINPKGKKHKNMLEISSPAISG